MVKGKNLWTCPRCKRQFERRGQSHSCRVYQLHLYFKEKPAGRLLYNTFKKAVKEQAGFFKTESLECCIHFVSTFTFAAVKVMKDKIRVSFTLGREIKSNRIYDRVQTSAGCYLYAVDICSDKEIDSMLMKWIQAAFERKQVKAPAKHHLKNKKYGKQTFLPKLQHAN
ncbi:MAG: hypothetical protein J0L56_06355 [Chitinophagales bacterium]|nr:hypothetical protein [Chitinophagales bacterium]